MSEQLIASRASEDDVKQVSQIMVRTVQQLEIGEASLAPNQGDHGHPWDDMGTDDETDPDAETPGFNDMSVEGQEAVQSSLSNAHHERKRLAKKKQTLRKCRVLAVSYAGFGRISSQGLTELVKRMIQAPFAREPSCSAPNTREFDKQERSAIGATVRRSRHMQTKV